MFTISRKKNLNFWFRTEGLFRAVNIRQLECSNMTIEINSIHPKSSDVNCKLLLQEWIWLVWLISVLCYLSFPSTPKTINTIAAIMTKSTNNKIRHIFLSCHHIFWRNLVACLWNTWDWRKKDKLKKKATRNYL